MGYYTRVFCRSEKSPTFTELQDYLRHLNPEYRLEGEVDDDQVDWTNFEFFYKEGNQPIPVELNWCDEEGSIGQEELAEFIEDIGSPGWSFKKRKVIRQLKKTKYIICNQLLGDIDDEGYQANESLLQFFIERYEGMAQADGEGFYGRDGKILC